MKREYSLKDKEEALRVEMLRRSRIGLAREIGGIIVGGILAFLCFGVFILLACAVEAI